MKSMLSTFVDVFVSTLIKIPKRDRDSRSLIETNERIEKAAIRRERIRKRNLKNNIGKTNE